MDPAGLCRAPWVARASLSSRPTPRGFSESTRAVLFSTPRSSHTRDGANHGCFASCQSERSGLRMCKPRSGGGEQSLPGKRGLTVHRAERIVTRGASKQEIENQQEADSSAKLNTGAARRRSIFADILPDLYEEQQDLPSSSSGSAPPKSKQEDDDELEALWERRLAPLQMKITGRLGRGSLAQVYLAEGAAFKEEFRAAPKPSWMCPTGSQVAVKVLLPKPSLQARVQREFVLEQEIWSQMDHPGIVRVIYSQKEPLDQRVIVMEVCEEGNLLEVLRGKDDVTGAPTAIDVPALAADIAAAILYMHRRGVAHRDIKSPNVLLTYNKSEGRLQAKMCDFSSATAMSKALSHRGPPPLAPSARPEAPKREGSMDEWVAWGVDLADLAVKAVAKSVTNKGSKGYLPVGTLAWMAPEMVLPPYQGDPILENEAAWGKCDVYGFACVMYELLTRQVPWPSDKKFGKNEVLQAVVTDGWRPPLPLHITRKLRALIEECWRADPTQRPSMAEAVERLSNLQAWSIDGSIEAEADEARKRFDQQSFFELSRRAVGGGLVLEVTGGVKVRLSQQGVKIGRLVSSDLKLTDNSVSRLHACIVATAGGFMLLDNNSSNGTTLNRTKVQAEGAFLTGKDVIKCGRVTIKAYVVKERSE